MIQVLRLSHRLRRDPRISTHVALVARAFGASKIYYSGQHDSSLEDSVNKITKHWGGPFEIEYIKDYLNLIKNKKKKGFYIVHLTCYGLELQKEIQKIREKKNILVVVGSEKVPPEIYKLADLNLSISSQPHSEVSSLSTFLYEYFNRKFPTFKNLKIKIIPQPHGKKTTKFI